MSVYPPPNEIVPIFNPLDYANADTTLTIEYADLHYLKYPVAQGTESFVDTINNGVANFNGLANFNGQSSFVNNINIGSSTSTNQTPIITTNKTRLNVGLGGSGLIDVACPLSVGGFGSILMTSSQLQMTSNANISQGATNTTANNLGLTNMKKPLTFDGTLNTDRIVNNVFYQLQDSNSLSTTTGQIYAGSGVFNYDNDSNGGSHNFATNTAGGVQTIPLTFNSVDMSIGTTNPPTCSASSAIATSDSSTKLPSTAWVKAVIASTPSSQYTYTQQFSGSSSLIQITIPTGCVKFDIKVFGTGGLAGGTNANPPSGPYPDYYLTMGGAGGGAGVAYKEGITIIKQGTGFTNSLTYDNSSVTSPTGFCEIQLNNVSLCKAYNGGTATLSAGGAGCTTPPVVNTTWGNWVYWNGQAGSGPSTSMSSPDTGQVGGGCQNGGIAGNGNISSSSSLINSAGQGQRYSALTGPTYGFPSYSASPINRGGCVITWYIQS